MQSVETGTVVAPPISEGPPPPVLMVQLLAGFQVAQALYVVAKLDVATALIDGPRSVDELAGSLGADPSALRRLLRTLAGLGVFTSVGKETYALTRLGTTLAQGSPDSVRDLALTWMETHYAPFGRLLDAVVSGQPAATLHYGMPFFDWLATDPDQVQRFTGAMAGLTHGIRVHAMQGYRLPGTVVADLGGADGSLLIELLEAEQNRERHGIVIDLPHVIPAARRQLEQRGLTDRIDVVGGDFFESVPAADVYLLSMIFHDWSDDQCARMLNSIVRATRSRTRLVALEFVLPPGDEPHMGKMIDLTMLGMLTGRERTADEYRHLFREAGFRLEKITPTPTPLSIIEATR